jgi:diacylglycerol kinase (ATP)
MSGTEVRIRPRRLRAVNTNGELSTHTPARVRVLPKAIVVLASRPAPTKPVQTD